MFRQMVLNRTRLQVLRTVSSVAVMAIAFAALLGGCGSDSNRDLTYGSSSELSNRDQTYGAVGGGASGVDLEFPNTVTGTLEDDQGDRATVTVGIGRPAPLAEYADQIDSQGCNDQLSSVGASEERSAAIPVKVTARVDSSLEAGVTVLLSRVFTVKGGGEVGTELELPTGFVLWTAEGEGCEPSTGLVEASTFSWLGSPGVTNERTAWLIVANVITPNDPDGAEVLSSLLLSPGTKLNQDLSTRYEMEPNPRIVRCFALDAAMGRTEYIAVDPESAVALGCGGTQPTPPGYVSAKDAACAKAYPTGSSETATVDDAQVITYDRQSSMFQIVCADFGKPEGVEYTLGMRCALVAAAATYAGAPSSADRLCDATSVVEAFESGDWIGEAGDQACGLMSEVFAGAAGVFASGATSASGPGAVAVGVGTYRALAGTLKIACGGLFDGGATDLGSQLEANHQTNVMLDVVRESKCLRFSNGRFRDSWSAVSC